MAPVEGADFVDLTEDRGSGATLFSADQDNICSPGFLSALYGSTSLVSLTSQWSVSVLANMLVTSRKNQNTSLPVGSARFICLHKGAKIKLSLTSSADQGIYNCHRGPRSINRLDGRKCLNWRNWATLQQASVTPEGRERMRNLHVLGSTSRPSRMARGREQTME